MANTILVDADAYEWLGEVIARMDLMSMRGEYIGKTTWEASNAYDALRDNLEEKKIDINRHL